MRSAPTSPTQAPGTSCKGCLAPYRLDAPLDAVGRYGRMFDLPALIADEEILRRVGASGGFCDASAAHVASCETEDGAGAGTCAKTDEAAKTGEAAKIVEAQIEAGWPLFGQYVAHDLTADRSPLTMHAEVQL